MSQDTIKKNHEKISSLLRKRSLHEAFLLLREQLRLAPDARIADNINRLEETYRYMIHYLVEGFADEGRESMLSSLVADLRHINDVILRNAMLPDSPDAYSAAKRFENIRKTTLQSRLDAYKSAYSKAMLSGGFGNDIEILKEHDDALLALFSYVWTMFDSPRSDYDLLAECMKSNEFPFEFKAQMISALLLGNLAYFDSNAFSALLDIYDAEVSQKISARAIVAILLIVAANPDRITEDTRISARLSLWQDSIVAYPRLREVLMSMLRSRDTERISNKMQNEVLPELMKLRPDIIKKLKNVSEELDVEMLEENPEWEEILNKNGLGDKLKELTDIQMEGGDVMMLAFSNLKNFPFFNSVANWFLPFSPTHSEVVAKDGGGLGTFSSIFEMEGVMCDSDKYSFAFSLNKMPEAQRKMMADHMASQMEQIKDAEADRRLKSSVPEFDAEVTRYVRDIYRFFKLFRRRQDFRDPFARPIDFRALPYLSDLLTDSEILNLVGEFYFKRGYYAEALPILLSLEKSSSEGTLLWEKIGYCYNALKDLENAMIWYRKAELINPDSRWLIRKLAIGYRMLNRFQEASDYYARALQSDPDNFSLLMSAGNCLLESDKPGEALSHYYHANYVKPDNHSVWKAIAWGELLNGNKEKSLEFYRRIIDSGEASPNDYLNAAHAAYLSGDLKGAVDYYLKCARDPAFGIARLEESVNEDMKTIENAGGNAQELHILIDKVKYDL